MQDTQYSAPLSEYCTYVSEMFCDKIKHSASLIAKILFVCPQHGALTIGGDY